MAAGSNRVRPGGARDSVGFGRYAGAVGLNGQRQAARRQGSTDQALSPPQLVCPLFRASTCPLFSAAACPLFSYCVPRCTSVLPALSLSMRLHVVTFCTVAAL